MSGLRKSSAPPLPLPLTFHLDGRPLRLLERPTWWWLRILASQPPGCWWFAVPASLEGEGAEHVVDRMLDAEDPLDLDDVERLAERVLGAALGVDLWAGHRLAQLAHGNWLAFDGWCASRGFDPLTQPVGRVLSAVYTWRVGLCEKKTDVQQVDAQVWAPPPQLTAAGRLRDQAPAGWDDDTEAAMFMAAMGQ